MRDRGPGRGVPRGGAPAATLSAGAAPPCRVPGARLCGQAWSAATLGAVLRRAELRCLRGQLAVLLREHLLLTEERVLLGGRSVLEGRSTGVLALLLLTQPLIDRATVLLAELSVLLAELLAVLVLLAELLAVLVLLIELSILLIELLALLAVRTTVAAVSVRLAVLLHIAGTRAGPHSGGAAAGVLRQRSIVNGTGCPAAVARGALAVDVACGLHAVRVEAVLLDALILDAVPLDTVPLDTVVLGHSIGLTSEAILAEGVLLIALDAIRLAVLGMIRLAEIGAVTLTAVVSEAVVAHAVTLCVTGVGRAARVQPRGGPAGRPGAVRTGAGGRPVLGPAVLHAVVVVAAVGESSGSDTCTCAGRAGCGSGTYAVTLLAPLLGSGTIERLLGAAAGVVAHAVLFGAVLRGRCGRIAIDTVLRAHPAAVMAGPVMLDPLGVLSAISAISTLRHAGLGSPAAGGLLVVAVLTDMILTDVVLTDMILTDAVLTDMILTDVVLCDVILTDVVATGMVPVIVVVVAGGESPGACTGACTGGTGCCGGPGPVAVPSAVIGGVPMRGLLDGSLVPTAAAVLAAGAVVIVRGVGVKAVRLGQTLLDRAAILVDRSALLLGLGATALSGDLLLLRLLGLALGVQAGPIGLELGLARLQVAVLDHLLLLLRLVPDLGRTPAVLLLLLLLLALRGGASHHDQNEQDDQHQNDDADDGGCG